MALVSRWSLGTSTPDNEGLQSTNPVGWGSRRLSPTWEWDFRSSTGAWGVERQDGKVKYVTYVHTSPLSGPPPWCSRLWKPEPQNLS